MLKKLLRISIFYTQHDETIPGRLLLLLPLLLLSPQPVAVVDVVLDLEKVF